MANEEIPPKPDKLSAFQKGAIGMFISTASVWEFLVKSPDIQKSLGIGYPWFLMCLTIFGLSCAAVSGPQIWEFIEGVKKLLEKKKE